MKGKMAGVDSEAERATFARNLRAARMHLRLRQKDICQITGIAQPHLSDIEAGGGNIALDTMVKLATAVNQPLWKLFKPGEIIDEEQHRSPPNGLAQPPPIGAASSVGEVAETLHRRTCSSSAKTQARWAISSSAIKPTLFRTFSNCISHRIGAASLAQIMRILNETDPPSAGYR